MSNQTLNQYQRKALEKLYDAQFYTARQTVIQEENDKFDKLVEVLDKSLDDKELERLNAIEDEAKDIRKLLTERYVNTEVDFRQDAQSQEYGLKYRTHAGYGQGYGKVSPVIKKWEEEKSERILAVDQAELEAKTVIWGLNVTFKAVQRSVDKLIKGVM